MRAIEAIHWAVKVGSAEPDAAGAASPTRQSSSLFVCRLVALEERHVDELPTAFLGHLQVMQAGDEAMSISGTPVDVEFLSSII
jgi:hypothetical protein